MPRYAFALLMLLIAMATAAIWGTRDTTSTVRVTVIERPTTTTAPPATTMQAAVAPIEPVTPPTMAIAAVPNVEPENAPIHSAAGLLGLVRSSFPEQEWATAERIVACESNWDPNARSRTGDTGLFQINDIHTVPGGVAHGVDLYDPSANIAVARALWESSGWHPWTCY